MHKRSVIWHVPIPRQLCHIFYLGDRNTLTNTWYKFTAYKDKTQNKHIKEYSIVNDVEDWSCTTIISASTKLS